MTQINNIQSSLQTLATFRAFVDAMIPFTPELSKYGNYMVPGAVNEGIAEFVIWEFDHSIASLDVMHPVLISGAVAQMLNSAANQLICSGVIRERLGNYFPDGGHFCSLSRSDRLLTLSFLEQLKVDLGSLPMPFKHNGRGMQIILDLMHRYTMFGYYSEWSGYGSTRLLTPEARKLEYRPISWTQIGYPGPQLL